VKTDWRKQTNACRAFAVKPARKRPLGRPRHKWEDNITMYFTVTV
jgi:hypothetical protein